MTTFFDELSSEISNNNYFKKQCKNLFIISVCKQLERIPNIRFLHNAQMKICKIYLNV